MRTRSRQLLVGALLAAAAVASDTAAAGAVDGAHSVATPPEITCPVQPVSATAPTASTRSTGGAAAAVVEATVPRLTLIHVVDGRLVVTTNTQSPPDPTDQFYVVTGKRARAATPMVREQVLRACR